MSFLSQYFLSLADCRALRITDSYSLHRVVLNLFPRERNQSRRILYADRGFDRDRLLIQILSALPPEIGVHGMIQTGKIPESFLEHEAYRFETIVNPVRRSQNSPNRQPLRDESEILAWFQAHGAAWGFEAPAARIDQVFADRFPKERGAMVTICKARISGVLKVTDSGKFKASFHNGIGKGKAFGCGLLQLEPLF